MQYSLVIKLGAELDISESMEWYEGQKEGLGSRYLDKLDEKMLKVESNPYHYQIRYKAVRIALLDVFPVGIHYTVEEDTIYVHAVLGTEEDPRFWI